MRRSCERRHDESRRDLARFAPEAIPTKMQLPQLARYFEETRSFEAQVGASTHRCKSSSTTRA
jgi:hypothetical protein